MANLALIYYLQDIKQQQPNIAGQRYVRGLIQDEDAQAVRQQSHLWLSLVLAGKMAEEGASPGPVHSLLLAQQPEGPERGGPAWTRVQVFRWAIDLIITTLVLDNVLINSIVKNL